MSFETHQKIADQIMPIISEYELEDALSGVGLLLCIMIVGAAVSSDAAENAVDSYTHDLKDLVQLFCADMNKKATIQ